jgi:DNA polymerase III epsilon subunit-like protein
MDNQKIEPQVQEERMNFLDRPIAFTDLEMTGLDRFRVVNGVFQPWHEICEIGLVLADHRTLTVLDTLDVKVKIEHPERFSPKALEVNGYREEDWKDALSLKEALLLYNQKVVDAVFAAHNVTYDWGFLEVAYALTGLESPMDYHRIDLLTNAVGVLRAKGYELDKYRQTKLAEFLGLQPEPIPHRAVNGAMSAYEVYKAIRELPMK